MADPRPPPAPSPHVTPKTELTEDNVLDKKEKGRLKKLLRRVYTLSANSPHSGLADDSNDDWSELQLLLTKAGRQEQLKFIGPSIHLRPSSTPTKIIKGHDVRDLLHVCLSWAPCTTAHLDHDDGSKKRKRSPSSTRLKIPEWVTLHNPALLQHVAVIELHVQGGSTDQMQALEREIRATFNSDQACLAVATTPVRWFHDKWKLQSMTDCLMYAPVESTESDRQQPSPPTIQYIVHRMVPLATTLEVMAAEGFPMPLLGAEAGTESEAETELFKAGTTLSSINTAEMLGMPLAAVRAMLTPLQVPVVPTPQMASMLTPFVASCSVPNSRPPQIYGLDCEMVKTTAGIELARITLLRLTEAVADSMQYKVVLDTLVRPKHAVMDYLTEYSGVTEASLQNVTVELEHVQAALVALVRAGDILTGHSLENDLWACRWLPHHRGAVHVVDTSLVFRRSPRFKHKLRHLAKHLLHRDIQTAQQSSHCSEEDACAALELAVQRGMRGPSFGLDRQSTNVLHDPDIGTVVCIGPPEWLQNHVTNGAPSGIHALLCETASDANAQALSAWLAGPKRRAAVVWASWTIDLDDDRTQSALLIRLHEQLGKIVWNDSIVMVGMQRNHSTASELGRLRQARRGVKSTIGWTESDDNLWMRALEDAREGAVMWIGKKIASA